MQPDAGGKVRASVEAMRSDARTWAAAAREIGQAHAMARNLTLGEEQFTPRFAEIVQASYTELQRHLAALLEAAAVEFDKVGIALRASAETYEREDAEGAHGLRKAGG